MSMRRKKAPERKKPANGGCCSTGLRPFETPLSKCLVFDPFHPSGATHDVDPFGVYQTQTDGTVVFRQVLRAAPGYVPCKTPSELDALIAKVFLAATRHGRRHMVVTKEYVRSFVRGKLFSGSPLQDGLEHTLVRGIPENVILCVDAQLPEELGRLCYNCGTYGVSLMDPYMVCSVEVVPVPFGHDHRRELEVLA